MQTKIPTRRYHYKVWMPEYLPSMLREFYETLPYVDVTKHAAEEMRLDKRGLIPLPSKEELFDKHNILVEVYEQLDKNIPNKIAQKLLIRSPIFSDKYDYAYVIAREGFIVSSWAIDKNDDHRLTESIEKYYNPGKRK